MIKDLQILSVQKGSKKIDFSLVFSERKTLGISVYPNKEVYVNAPVNTALEIINERVKKRATWIIKQQIFFESFQPITPVRKYISGETHLYLGKQYRLKLIESKEENVKLQRGYFFINTNNIENKEKVKALLEKWYRKKADEKFPVIFKQATSRIKKYNINCSSYDIRYMPKRWGSCTPKGKILINPEIIKAPKACIEYVMTHELCHLKYHNHSQTFYDLQSKIMPDWQKLKNKLEKIMV